jgi:hypothetical protein
MYANDHSLGGKHFWPQAKGFVGELDSKAAKQIDDQYVTLHLLFYIFIFHRMKALPPLWDLIHFDQVMSIQFLDANKFCNLLKVQNLLC